MVLSCALPAVSDAFEPRSLSSVPLPEIPDCSAPPACPTAPDTPWTASLPVEATPSPNVPTYKRVTQHQYTKAEQESQTFIGMQHISCPCLCKGGRSDEREAHRVSGGIDNAFDCSSRSVDQARASASHAAGNAIYAIASALGQIGSCSILDLLAGEELVSNVFRLKLKNRCCGFGTQNL